MPTLGRDLQSLTTYGGGRRQGSGGGGGVRVGKGKGSRPYSIREFDIGLKRHYIIHVNRLCSIGI